MPGRRPAVGSATAVTSSWLAAVLAGARDGYCAIARPLIVRCFVFFFCPFLLLFTALAWLILLPTKVNKMRENPRDYIIVRAKIR